LNYRRSILPPEKNYVVERHLTGRIEVCPVWRDQERHSLRLAHKTKTHPAIHLLHHSASTNSRRPRPGNLGLVGLAHCRRIAIDSKQTVCSARLPSLHSLSRSTADQGSPWRRAIGSHGLTEISRENPPLVDDSRMRSETCHCHITPGDSA
jgi:hypothetical protein